MSAFADELRERGLYDQAHAICLPLGLKIDELLSRSRAPIVVEARARFSKFLRDEKGWSYPMIGRLLRKDHTTILALIGEPRGRRARLRLLPRLA